MSWIVLRFTQGIQIDCILSAASIELNNMKLTGLPAKMTQFTLEDQQTKIRQVFCGKWTNSCPILDLELKNLGYIKEIGTHQRKIDIALPTHIDRLSGIETPSGDKAALE